MLVWSSCLVLGLPCLVKVECVEELNGSIEGGRYQSDVFHVLKFGNAEIVPLCTMLITTAFLLALAIGGL